MIGALERVLAAPVSALLALAGPEAKLVQHEMQAWPVGSGFNDVRHEVAIRFAGTAVADGERYIQAVAEHEFTLPALYVSECVVRGWRYCPMAPRELVVTVELLVMDLGMMAA